MAEQAGGWTVAPRRSRRAVLLLLFALAYAGLNLLGSDLKLPSVPVPVFSPAAGLLLAVLLSLPRGAWPGILGSAAAMDLLADCLLRGQPVALSVTSALANATASLLGAAVVHLLRRGRTEPVQPGAHLRDTLALALAALLGPAAGAAIGVPSIHLLIIRWFAAALGTLAVATPILLVLAGRRAPGISVASPRRLETILVALACAAGAIAIFWSHPQPAVNIRPPAPPLLILPALCWASLRLTGVRASLALLLVCLLCVAGTAAGGGTFATLALRGLDPRWEATLLQVFLLAVVVIVLLLIATTAERRAAHAALEAANAGLEAKVAARTRALAESESRLRSIGRAMPSLMFVADAGGANVEVNEGFCTYTGQPKHALLGDGWVRSLHPDDRGTAVAIWQDAVSTGAPYAAEYRFGRADGTWRWHQVRGMPFEDADGARFWVGMCTDIHDRRLLEEQLRDLNDELEQRVVERTRNLHETELRLAQAQRTEALGQLAGGIAHDFNNVLQAVSSAATLIARRPADAAAVDRLARTTLDAVERGSGITRRLLAFSRRGVLSAVPVDPRPLLADMRDILSHTIGASITVRTHVAEDAPVIEADKGHLETVLVNLATNARDAMPEGGLLVMRAERDVVDAPHPAGLASGTYLRLAVSDTGTGMPPAVLARVTEPFFSTKDNGRGTGLGLAMAKSFAEQSGGTLAIESQPGHGTTVRLWIPASLPDRASDDAPPDPAANAPAPARERRPTRILLVDDDDIVREVTAEQLAGQGYDVIKAGSAAEALATLDAGESVDVLVTDLSMPQMDGMTLIGEARRRQHLPAILLTGHAGAAPEIEAPGSVALLRKPATIRQLAQRIEQLA